MAPHRRVFGFMPETRFAFRTEFAVNVTGALELNGNPLKAATLAVWTRPGQYVAVGELHRVT